MKLYYVSFGEHQKLGICRLIQNSLSINYCLQYAVKCLRSYTYILNVIIRWDC